MAGPVDNSTVLKSDFDRNFLFQLLILRFHPGFREGIVLEMYWNQGEVIVWFPIRLHYNPTLTVYSPT